MTIATDRRRPAGRAAGAPGRPWCVAADGDRGRRGGRGDGGRAHRVSALPAQAAHLVDDDRQDEDEEEHGERRALAGLRRRGTPGVHLVGHDARVELAAGHRPDDVEDLEHGDRDRHEDDDHRGPDARQRHPPEHLPGVDAVQPGGLDDVGRDALDGGGEHHHREAGLDPDHDDDEEAACSAARSSSHCCGSPPSQTQIWFSRPIWFGLLGPVGVDELPDDAGADERDRHRHEDRGLGERLDPWPCRSGSRRSGRSTSRRSARAATQIPVFRSTVRISGWVNIHR